MNNDFNDAENKYSNKLPAYIYKYEDLHTFIKYLTNYIITAEDAINDICRNSTLFVTAYNGNAIGAQGDLLRKIGYKVNTKVPTGLNSENTRTVIKGTVLNRSSTGSAEVLKNTIIGLFGGYFTEDDIVIEDKGITIPPTLMSYSISFGKAFVSDKEKDIIKEYMMPEFDGVNSELQLVSGEIFSFDKEEPLDPNAPPGSIGERGWDLGTWAEIVL